VKRGIFYSGIPLPQADLYEIYNMSLIKDVNLMSSDTFLAQFFFAMASIHFTSVRIRPKGVMMSTGGII
jgi:hypothetical protein